MRHEERKRVATEVGMRLVGAFYRPAQLGQ
jgi:hypothetical protein